MALRWLPLKRIAVTLCFFVGPTVTAAHGQVCGGPINPAVPNPTNVHAVVVGSTVTISWNLQPGTTALLCVYRTAGGVVFEGLVGAVNSVSGTIPPGDYGYRVSGVNAAGQSVFLTQFFRVGGEPVFTAPGVPGTPTFTLNGLHVALFWAAPQTGGPIVDYIIEVGSVPSASNIAVFITSAPTLSGVAAPGIYYIRLRGRNAVGVGPASQEIVLNLTGGATPPPGGSWLPCSAIVRSIVSAVPVPIQFVNVSSQPRLLYWVDFAGVRQPYGVLAPGQSGFLTSFVTHSWVITDVANNCLGTLVITGGGQISIP